MPLPFLSRRKPDKDHAQAIIVVSGLPRSGTSLMMQILATGGVEILTDMERRADEDNPKGYYELERVKKLKDGDTAWLSEAPGKAVKIVSALLEHLPGQYRYKILFMERPTEEILASQRQMLIRRGEPTDKVDEAVLGEIFDKHLAAVKSWLAGQENIEAMFINYAELIANPQGPVQTIVDFLGLPLDADAMARIPDQNLYRQRR